jgi:ribosomal protein S18 acetylase RimI-like enzyme
MTRPVAKSVVNLRCERLNVTHNRAHFACEVEALTEYLHRYAGQTERGDLAACFVALDAGDAVMGYYTLSAHAVLPGELDDVQAKGLPRHDRIPAFLIGRLARHVSAKGRGVGELLIADAFTRLAASEAAGRLIVVDPIDAHARAFYERFGFTPLGRATHRLFIPMATVRKAVK